MSTKRKLIPMKVVHICVPGETEDTELSTDAALKDEPRKKATKRQYSKASTSDVSSSSTDVRSRLRSNSKKGDVDVKPTFPPPIDLTIFQDKRATSAVPYDELCKKEYFVDKTDLIQDIYMSEVRAKYYCFPRAGTKSTVISKLLHWLQYDDATREERLKCFENTKIFNLAKESDGTVKDGAIGFNQHIIIAADFGRVVVEEKTFEEMKISVTNEFCTKLFARYSLSADVKAELLKFEADDILFFHTLVDRIKDVLPSDSSRRRPVLLIIDNFDGPTLRILNREKSSTLALKLMGFFNFMLGDVSELDSRLFTKILLFGTHQPIGMNTKSFLKKIPVESYPYGRQEICTKFFFSKEEVKIVLKNCGKDENKVDELEEICGQYNIKNENYFHPGCIINYVTREPSEDISTEEPVYWCSVDSLDILADTAVTLPYEMPLWTYQEDQEIDFKYQRVLIYENFVDDVNTAYTYLLEGGYLTRIMNSNPPKYRIVNAEARNLFAARYKLWQTRIPSLLKNVPLCKFELEDYNRFFAILNDILKKNYAGEDFMYEGQYHNFVASFFHNIEGWYFKSNNQSGFGKFDFVTWNKNPLIEIGYLFEMAIVKPSTNNPKLEISKKINEKKDQVERKEYVVVVEKKIVKCFVVVGCRKMLSYQMYDISK